MLPRLGLQKQKRQKHQQPSIVHNPPHINGAMHLFVTPREGQDIFRHQQRMMRRMTSAEWICSIHKLQHIVSFVMLSHVRKNGNRLKFLGPKPGILLVNNSVTHLKIRASFCIPYFAANFAAKSWRPYCVSARRFLPFESCPDRTKWSRNRIEIKKINKRKGKWELERKRKVK